MSYTIALVPNVSNFHPKYRGTVVGILDAMFSAGTSIFVAIYGACFVKDEENQDIGGFFLTLAITGAVVNSFGFIFIGYYRVEDIPNDSQDYIILNATESTTEYGTENASGENTSIDGEKNRSEITGCELVKNVDFQLIFWTGMAYISVVGMYPPNVNVYLRSFQLEQHSTLFNILLPIFAVLGKFFCGVISDALLHMIPRPVVLLTSSLLLLIMMSTCIFFASNFYVLLVTTMVVGLSFGASWTLYSTIIADYFGLKYFGRNYGACAMLTGVAVIIIQWINGAIYQAAIPNPGETSCYGLNCFRWSFFMAAILVLCGVICNILLIRRRYLKRANKE
jgi:hypothetical protein